MSPLPILISAGEASGDLHAARLAAALRERRGAQLFGLGGERMREAGVELLAESREVSVVGISEVVSRLPRVWSVYRQLVAEARRRRPPLAILVDFPDFNLRLARQLHALGIRLVYFISPQVWAWRRERVRQIRQFFEHVICIFPFEEDFYRSQGVAATFVGHPLAEDLRPRLTREAFCEKFGLDAGKPIVALLPGSRLSELRHHLAAMLAGCATLGERRAAQFVLPLAPGLDAARVAELVLARGGSEVVQREPGRFAFLCRYARGQACRVEALSGWTWEALAAADAAVVASGTATVEAALLETPMVVVYRLSALTAALARRMVKLPHFAMPNLIAGRAIVPELFQEQFTPEAVAAELERLLGSAEARERMRRDLREVRERLRGPGDAIGRAAELIAALL